MSYRITLQGIREATRETPAAGTARVLIDRLWPRGLRKDALGDIQWLREASPDTELRKGLHGGTLTPQQFRTRYHQQLRQTPDALLPLMRLARQGPLQLLTATHDPQTSYLDVLRQAVLDALLTEDRECDSNEPSSPVCYAGLKESGGESGSA